MFKKMTTYLCLIVLVAFAMNAGAQEHPEHPADNASEQPADDTAEQQEAAFTVGTETMAVAIKSFIADDTKLKGGYFLIFDSKLEKPLTLKLDKVHEERLSQVGENLYFACSDFTEVDGTVFDLDFFMKEVDGKLVVTEVLIHKEDGAARYTWFEDNGLWKTKSTTE